MARVPVVGPVRARAARLVARLAGVWLGSLALVLVAVQVVTVRLEPLVRALPVSALVSALVVRWVLSVRLAL